jgi:hypothetical protein
MDRRWLVAGAVALGSLVGAQALRAQGGEATVWLHVRVEEGPKSKVSVNLPMNVVEAVLSAAPDTVVRDGKFRIGRERCGISVSDMRRAWAELKSVGDTELVSVEEEDETVKVERKGDLVRVRVNRKEGGGVNVDVPVALVDAAFSGDGETIDVRSLVRELAKRRGDVVQVDEKDNKVRIWVDESNTGGK